MVVTVLVTVQSCVIFTKTWWSCYLPLLRKMEIVLVKCNITSLVEQEIARVRWGISCESAYLGIVEHYIKNIGCSTVDIVPCNTDTPCPPGAGNIVFECNFNIIGISAQLNPADDPDNADIIFNLSISNYIGGKLPFTYTWIYDHSDFDLIGDVTSPEIKLRLKPGKNLLSLVSQIGVEVIESSGCRDTKYCWLTPGGMQCSVNYHACSNPVDLNVVYNYIACSFVKTLTITHS